MWVLDGIEVPDLPRAWVSLASDRADWTGRCAPARDLDDAGDWEADGQASASASQRYYSIDGPRRA